LVLIGMALGVGSFFFVKKTFRGIERAEESYQAVVEIHGKIEEFTPAWDGAIAPSRLELFLAVRDSLSLKKARLDSLLDNYPGKDVTGRKTPLHVVFGVLKSLGHLIGPLAEFAHYRHQVLLRSEMGIGEYLYIYFLGYYTFLAHSPEDGPVIAKKTGGRRIRREDRIFGNGDSTFGPQKVRRRYRWYMLAMLRNQLEALLQEDSSGWPGNRPSWRDTLAAEIRSFEGDPRRVAWQDGLPVGMAESLAPFRERLEVSYWPRTNCFELPPREEGDWEKWSRWGTR
jgi:hypothetical protein